MHKWTVTIRIEDELEPLTMVEALTSVHWREAMEREHQLLVYNDIEELILLPPNKTVVSGKWCYRATTDAGGTVQWHKDKYIAQGFIQ